MGTCPVLKVVEMLASPTDERSMLRGWDLYPKNDAIAQFGDSFFQFLLELSNELGLSPEADLIRRLTLTRATNNIRRKSTKC